MLGLPPTLIDAELAFEMHLIGFLKKEAEAGMSTESAHAV